MTGKPHIVFVMPGENKDIVIPDEEKKKRRSGNRCCAPGCESGSFVYQEKVSLHRFPKDRTRKKLWESKVPRINWTSSSNSRLCEKHFTADSYKQRREDKKNRWRLEKKGDDLFRKELREDAVPSLWPNCPEHLSKYSPMPRTSQNSSGLQTSVVDDEKPDEGSSSTEIVSLSSLYDLNDLLDTHKLPASVSYYM